MEKAIGIGAGGHAKVVVEILKLTHAYEIAGLLDSDKQKVGLELAGIPILGNDSLLRTLFDDGIRYAFVSLGSVGDSKLRRKLFDDARQIGYSMISAVHPNAIVSELVRLGTGNTIMAGCVINPGTQVGDNVILNTGSIVDHDCTIASHVHIATGACLSGGVTVGEGAHVGAGAVVRQGISIGPNSIVGAGAVVVKDVPANVTVLGVPAKIFKGTAI